MKSKKKKNKSDSLRDLYHTLIKVKYKRFFKGYGF